MCCESGLKISRLKTSCIFSLLWVKLRSRATIQPLAPKLSPIRNLALQSLRFLPKSLEKKQQQTIQVSSPVAVPAGSMGSPPRAKHSRPPSGPQLLLTASVLSPIWSPGKPLAWVFRDGPAFKHSAGGPTTYPGCPLWVWNTGRWPSWVGMELQRVGA